MKINFETIDFSKALTRLLKLVGNVETVLIVAEKESVSVAAQNEGTYARFYFSAIVSEEGEACLETNALKTIFKNRKSVEIKTEKNTLRFKAGSSKDFAGNLVLSENNIVKVKKKKTDVSLSKYQVAFIKKAIDTLGIQDVLYKEQLPLIVYFQKKKATAYVASRYHFAYMKGTVKKGNDFSLSVPYNLLQKTLSAIESNSAISMRIKESSIMFSGEDFFISAALQGTQGIEKKAVESILKMDQCAKVSVSGLVGCSANFKAIITPQSSLSIETSNKKLQLSMDSTKGSLKQALDCDMEKKVEFNVKYEVFVEFLSRMQSEAAWVCLSEKAWGFMSKGEDAKEEYTYAAGLLQK